MLKVGQRVQIAGTSSFYPSQGQHGTGTVVRHTDNGWWRVKFDDEYVNSYRPYDLLILSDIDVSESPRDTCVCGGSLLQVDLEDITSECPLCGSLVTWTGEVLLNSNQEPAYA